MRRKPNEKSQQGSVRIIGGEWRGRRVEFPPNAGARPTPDRVRETLFNWLGPGVVGARCLDLFAGSGVLGFEALSRGAEEVVFVERDRRLAQSIQRQGARLGGKANIRQMSAERYLEESGSGGFDIIFLDPPYRSELRALLDRTLELLEPGGCVYVERSLDEGLPESFNGSWRRRARAGKVAFGLAEPGSPEP